MSSKHQSKIVVLGGGTGTHVVLRGLKDKPLHISAVISVADSGGSTGRLRDEFGFQPVGDIRQAVAALASDENGDSIRDLLLYRFTKGDGLYGHNLGNLILTAFQDMTGSTTKALEIVSKIFHLCGEIYPVTDKDIQLVIEYEDGTVEIGEKALDKKHGGERIVSLKTSPKAVINSQAKQALQNADLIVIGPGDLYGSIMANLVIDGVRTTLNETKAKIVYIANLMTRYTQTHGMRLSDHIKVIEQAINRPVDYVIVNKAKLPKEIVSQYELQHEFPVIDDMQYDETKIIRGNFVRPLAIATSKADTLPRSFLRHDSLKLGQVLVRCLE